MKHQPHPRNAIRMLAAISVLLTVATSTALAVRLLDAPSRSQRAATSATAAAPTASYTEGLSIDHSIVNRERLDTLPEEAGISVAAYGP